MLTGTELLNGTLSATTNAVKPAALWGSTLKAIIATHPVVFLAVTGGALVSVGTYYYAADKLKKKKSKQENNDSVKDNSDSIKDNGVIEELEPV